MSHSYYSAPVSVFLAQSESEILGVLTQAHCFALDQNQRDAWLTQIRVLKDQLAGFKEGHLYFEFVIPRVGKRADCILLYRNVIYVIEFKVGSQSFDRHAIDQVHDYALDLKNFHRGSHAAIIVPILIATQAQGMLVEPCLAMDMVAEPILAGSNMLRPLLELNSSLVSAAQLEDWGLSGYLPTPTIVEAARALYQAHDVSDIARSDAGAMNLAVTNAYIAQVIETAKANRQKAICFVTGVPGAGKTLAGLNIATRRAAAHADEHAVFLSGNGPLVSVLREALVRDQLAREGGKRSDSERQVNAFIQNIHHFRDEYLREQAAPVEKVVVFDEAQRAWTREQASRFMQQKRGQSDFNQSEPEFLIRVMDRHRDWCVIVCLIGGGQEINTGEAGLAEWLLALQTYFPDWQIHASSLLETLNYQVDAKVLAMIDVPRVLKDPALHLAVSMRSFRAEQLNAFVSALLDGDQLTALNAYKALDGRYPIRITRDLNRAREWLRAQARGSERYGLVASSGALRLRSEGLYVKNVFDPENWFLNDRDDVRSSFYLEEVGNEFNVQGLELDWVGLGWDADLRWGLTAWELFNFRGTCWQKVQAEERRRYLVNAYRVLLTRARQGMVIFVPRGDIRDATRSPAFYDGTFELLCACGIERL